MRTVQTLSIKNDRFATFSGYDVSNSGYAEIIIDDQETLDITAKLADLSDLEIVSIDTTMKYHATVKQWSIDIDAIKDYLEEGHRYAMHITGDNINPFNVDEFIINDIVYEDLLVLPYEMVFTNGEAIQCWYSDVSLMSNNDLLAKVSGAAYIARLYTGNTGMVPATNSDEVTHRGPVTRNF